MLLNTTQHEMDILLIVIVITVLLPLSKMAKEGRPFLDGEKDCPQKVDLRIYLSSAKVPQNQFRALRTVPDGFAISPSSIPAAGLGAFSKTFIRAHTWLGEYEGVYRALNSEMSRTRMDYSWSIYRGGLPSHFVDASITNTSNWLRYVNCARHVSEQNVHAATCYGRIHYRTMIDVAPETELLVYYGPKYAKKLGINPDQYFKNKSSSKQFK